MPIDPNLPNSIRISSLETPDDEVAFHDINEAWISQLFSMTDADHKVLGNPRGEIIERGGDVLIARNSDGSAVGCVALLPHGNGVFELSKMGVSPHAQGAGIGRRLVEAAIQRARELDSRTLFLGTNSRLRPAIKLYEAAGFRPLSREELPVTDYYARADVLMALPLEGVIAP